MKVAINDYWGGFGVSPEFIIAYNEKAGTNFNPKYSHQFDDKRSDPILIEVIEEIGTDVASYNYSKIKIVEIPDDIDYEIHDYDGMETIHEKHRSWG
jgi:hypothetical protein